ncbi:uncharacterized protein LOC110907823 [Helianthus annuus]|uniref:uncharacterized protein LOC110907823 n=1 Tax=Helianthus annuus TaxID=4232 RepID=UPI000B8FFC76|nr:uncharacterized protein LOC110907823 [Helianthus annuus]
MADREGAQPNNAMVIHERTGSSNLVCLKLTSTNYNTWTVMMEAILDAQELWEAVDPVTGDAVDAKKNKVARAIIYSALPENILSQVATTRSARDIWEALRVRFLGADRVQQARLQSLKRELNQLKMKETETVEEFAGKIGEISNKFRSLGATLDDKDQVKKLLDSMPDKFIAIVATIEQVADLGTMTVEDCIGRLKAFEERIKGREVAAELMGKLMLSNVDSQFQRTNDQDRRNQSGRGRGNNYSRGRGRGRGQGGGRGRGRNQQNSDNRNNQARGNNDN